MKKKNKILGSVLVGALAATSLIGLTGCTKTNAQVPYQAGNITEVATSIKKTDSSKITQLINMKGTMSAQGIQEHIYGSSVMSMNYMTGEMLAIQSSNLFGDVAGNETFAIWGETLKDLAPADLKDQVEADNFYCFTVENEGENSYGDVEVIPSAEFGLRDTYDSMINMFLDDQVLEVIKASENEVEIEYNIKTGLINNSLRLSDEFSTFFTQGMSPVQGTEEEPVFESFYNEKSIVDLSARNYENGTKSLYLTTYTTLEVPMGELESEPVYATMNVYETVEFVFADGMLTAYNYSIGYETDAEGGINALVEVNVVYQYDHFATELAPTATKLMEIAELPQRPAELPVA